MVNIIVNLSVAGGQIPPVVHTVQGDTGRTLEAHITDMDIPSGATAKFWAVKPSGAGVSNTATISGDVVEVDLTNQTLAEAGDIQAQLQIQNRGQTVKTFCFVIRNGKSLAGDYPESENESTWLDQQLEAMQTLVSAAVDNANSAASGANSAAASASQAASNANQAAEAIEDAVPNTLFNDNQVSGNTGYTSQKIKNLLDDKVDAYHGNASHLTADFEQASSRVNILSGEELATMLGKISKYLADLENTAFDTFQDIAKQIYPVGSIYMSVKSTSPATLFGGTWVRWGNGRVPVGVDTTQKEFNSVEKIGGEKTHRLTEDEMPAHQHFADNNNGEEKLTGNIGNMGFSASSDEGASYCYTLDWGYRSSRTDTGIKTAAAGGGDPHNNLQPYITCYMWKRTA